VQFPPDIAEFTGRDHELAELRERVRGVASGDARAAVMISAIDGKPGIGRPILT